jgi:hypothetical protein
MSRGKLGAIIAVSIILVAGITGWLIVSCTPVGEATSSNVSPAPPAGGPMGTYGGVETMDDQTREILRQRFANITVVPLDTMIKIYSRLHSEGIFPRPPALDYHQDDGTLIISLFTSPQREIPLPLSQGDIDRSRLYPERIIRETVTILKADGIHVDVAAPYYSRVILDPVSQPHIYGRTLWVGTMYYHADTDTHEWILNENPEYK